MNDNKQIFQSQSDKRWRLFKGTLRIVLVGVVIATASIVVDVIRESSPSLPHLREANEVYKRVLNPEKVATFTTRQNKRFKQSLDTLKMLVKDSLKQKNKNTKKDKNLRAGFYVNWDAQSFYSLKEHIDKLTIVMPEWIFIPDNADTAVTDIDTRALNFMKNHGVQITPMISNYFNQKWNSGNASRIIRSKEKRNKFIASVIRILSKYKFNGVNVDLENLDEKDQADLVSFQKDLYTELHKKGFTVSQDITPFEQSYNLGELQKYNDNIVLMAYDLHYSTSSAGPITDPAWLEKILDQNSIIIPPKKIILGLAAYGYDWPQGDEAEDITYSEALERAYENEEKVVYDYKSNNLTFNYDDDNHIKHSVWFTDAVYTYNTIRLAEEYGIAGVALWRLGGEDSRIWKFFNLDLNSAALDKNPFNIDSLKYIRGSNNLDFQGEGEILDIVSTPNDGKIEMELDGSGKNIKSEKYIELPSTFLIKKYGVATPKQIVLSFDDGPDEKYTPQVLDILKKEKIPAVFFVVGVNAENNLQLLKRIYNEGHEIGNHTFLHPNLAEISNERVSFELNTTRRLIESITGHSTVLFRAPYNADSEPENRQEILPLIEAKKHHYYSVGESIDPQDWQPGVSVDSIVVRITSQLKNGSIILLHDSGGDRSKTIEALPIIIKYFKDRGYTFTTVATLLGKSRDDIMPQLQDRGDLTLANINWSIATVIFFGERFVYAIFTIGIILAVLRLLFIAILAIIQKKKTKSVRKNTARPIVSLIVPAYNEEIHIVKNIENLLRGDYPNYELVFIDDGSKDNTYKAVKDVFAANEKVTILTKPNGGKSTALNYGILNAKGEIVVCIDADTQLMPDAISRLIEYFTDENVAAVAGNVKVGNEHNLLTRWQSLEYITSQNYDRRAFDLLNCITVVPGAIGAFRKEALEKIGGFAIDTLAEDCDLTIRLLRAGYRVTYSEKALAYTEAPESIKMFLKQRFRWSYGIMQSLWKHRDTLFNKSYKNLGLIALPNVLIFQFILPVFSPLAELMMLLAIFGGYLHQLIVYYLLFLAVDLAAAAIALSFEKTGLTRLWVLIPQRFFYRQLMYWVLLKSIIAAIRGTLVGWGILKRTGKVKVGTL